MLNNFVIIMNTFYARFDSKDNYSTLIDELKMYVIMIAIIV